MRSFLMIAALALAGASAAVEAREITFTGGVLDGLRAEVLDGQPGAASYFRPGLARHNPPSAPRRARIDALLADTRAAFAADKSRAGAYPAFPGKRAPNEDWSHFGGRMLAQCRLEEPFEVDGGARVRIGIACGGRIAQFFIVSFSGDKVTSFEIDEAAVPNTLAGRSGG